MYDNLESCIQKQKQNAMQPDQLLNNPNIYFLHGTKIGCQILDAMFRLSEKFDIIPHKNKNQTCNLGKKKHITIVIFKDHAIKQL